MLISKFQAQIHHFKYFQENINISKLLFDIINYHVTIVALISRKN